MNSREEKRIMAILKNAVKYCIPNSKGTVLSLSIHANLTKEDDMKLVKKWLLEKGE